MDPLIEVNINGYIGRGTRVFEPLCNRKSVTPIPTEGPNHIYLASIHPIESKNVAEEKYLWTSIQTIMASFI